MSPVLEDNASPLQDRVRSALSGMTAAERRIAELLVDDPAAAAQLTISDLSTRAGTSESSVVRTARSLGFAGYQELRLALAAAGAAVPSGRLTLTGDITRHDSLQAAVEKLATAEVAALRATSSQIDINVLEAVVAQIGSARRIDIYGMGVSGLVASDLWQKLMRIGRNCIAFNESHLALTSASLLGPGDVVVVISYSGEVIDVLEPARLALDSGATVVAVTSQPRSTLAKLATHVLLSAGRSEPLLPGAMAGRMSQLLVTDAIFVGVAQLDYDASLRTLRHTSAALDARRQRRRKAR